MAHYQVLSWKHLPSQIKAWDETGEVKHLLSQRFQVAIDAAAMADGSMATDDYLEGWAWGPVETRDGPGADVLRAVVAELEARFQEITKGQG